MNVVGSMVWYDEQPSLLASSVSGLARIADHIVAVDGAYALYPGGRPRSHTDQAEAIVRTSEAMGVGCTVHRPSDVFWGNEVEKRQLSLDLARPFCTSERDWILVWDADYHILQTQPELVRYELERTDRLAATYTLLDNRDTMADGLLGYAATHDIEAEWTTRTRGFFRWTDDLRYGPAHYTISGTYDGERRWVYGPDLIVGETENGVPAFDLDHLMVAYHRRDERPLVRRQAADVYCKVRDAAGIESLPGSGLRSHA